MTDSFLSTTERFQTGTAGIEVNYMHNAAPEHTVVGMSNLLHGCLLSLGIWCGSTAVTA